MEDKFITVKEADQRYVASATFDEFKDKVKEVCDERHKAVDVLAEKMKSIDQKVWAILLLMASYGFYIIFHGAK